MCSIFGVLDIKTDAGELRKKALELSRLMRHRGPDWSGVYASDKAILAHERLSIVDVNAGAQPLYNEKKTHALAVNGEIYIHQALRAEYGDRYAFQTGSDCEVILALYQEKGPEFLDDLQGMFAFALYDSEKDAYLIGRDHIGIIPLYMGHDEHGNFYVASEMKALVPVCRTIKEFPAGSYLWSKDGEIRPYYQRDWFDYDAVKDNVTDKAELRQALEDSVKSHLMSDVPYGVLLSGGLDSSVISAITKKFAARRVEDQERSEAWWPQLHSFAVGLEGAPDLNFDFMKLPVMEGFDGESGMDVANWGIGIADNCENKEEAMQFVEYLMSPEVNAKLSELANAFPGNSTAEPDYSKNDELFQKAYDLFQECHAINEFTGLPTSEDLMRSFDEQLQLYLDGDTSSAADMLKATQDIWEPAFE